MDETESNEETNMIKKSNNQQIDKLTLEFLTNKTQYNKYLSKSDPNKYEETMDHYRKINKYREQIMDITDMYCNNPNKQITNQLDDMFNAYVRTCIQYFEMKELENNDEYTNNADEDTLFLNIDNDNGPVKEYTKSFWGKGAIKTNGIRSDLRAFSGKR